MDLEKITKINEVIKTYFLLNLDVDKVPAKDLMPDFIKSGIFTKDHRNGLPIRNILRELDRQKTLYKIPYLLAERKKTNTNWFFIRIEKESNFMDSLKENPNYSKITEIIQEFKGEAGELFDLFKIFSLPIAEAEASQEDYIYHPGVYVYLEGNQVIKVGRSLSNSRKRSLEHIQDGTKNEFYDMKNLKNNPNAILLLFNLKETENAHWAAAFEIFLENKLKPLIPTKRSG